MLGIALNTRRFLKEIAVLVVASCASVGLVAVGLLEGLEGEAPSTSGVLPWLPVTGLAIAASLAGYFAWRGTRPRGRGLEPFKPEALTPREDLAAGSALLMAEPQILILWDKNRRAQVIINSLSSVPGLPSAPVDLARFEQWLDGGSARSLQSGVEALFAVGKPFGAILKTVEGGHLEADARAAGGRIVLRLRDIAGHRRDLVEIIDRHQRLVRDIRGSRALLETLPFPAWAKDGAGRLSWVNAAYVKAVEVASEVEVLERQIELLDSRQRQSVDRALAREQSYRRRVQVSIGGDRRPHEVVVLPIDGASAAMAIDVAAIESARKDAESEGDVYDRALDRMATAVAIFSRDQKLVFHNDAYLKLWGLDAGGLDGAPSSGAVLDRLRELGRLPEVVNYREWREKVLSWHKTGLEQSDWWHLPDGRVLHVAAEPRPDGGVTFLFVDETERLAHESRFNALIAVQRETLDSLKEGVAVFAGDGRLTLHNSAFAVIWKLDSAALEGNPHIDDIIRRCRSEFKDDQVWSEIGKAVTAYSEDRGSLSGQMPRSDGSVVDFAATPLTDGATLLTFSDVTASKNYERALIERSEALIMADRLKDQFMRHISHELRTPLENVIGFSELLASPRAGALNGKQREFLKDIMSSSKTLLAIIDDILDMATLDAGALELKLGPVDVRQVIDAAIQGVRDRAARARLTLDIGIADDAVTFEADEARVRQVLYNLLSNAIGFSAAEKVVHLACWREDGKMIFIVEDEGVGIPKDQQSVVFERFESRTQGLRHRGAGLGLSIVKSLVDLHGGDMELKSEPGRGTSVTVRFPEKAVRRAAAGASPRAKVPARKPEKSVAA